MSEHLRDQLSAFIDDELPRHEIELLFKRLDGNAGLRDTLARYSLIGESLRTRSAEGPSRKFAERVRAAVRESGPLATATAKPVRWHRWRWLKSVAGIAVAATVAAIALIGLQRLQSPLVEQRPQLAASDAASDALQPVVVGETAAGEQPSYIVPAPAAASSRMNAARLTNYVVAHSEYSSPLGRRSVLSGIVAEGSAPPDSSNEQNPDTSADLTVEQQ